MIKRVGRIVIDPQGIVQNLLVPLLALVTALVIGAVVMVATDDTTIDAWGDVFSDPGGALAESWELVWEAYKALFVSSLGSWDAFGASVNRATPLMLAGLAVALAFQAGLFNIGGEGQILAGTVCAGFVGFHWDMPMVIHLPLALVAGALGGFVWGGIAGVLKARTGAHEVITTIMLNFVAVRLLDYLLTTDPFLREGRTDPLSPPVHGSAELPDLGSFHAGILVALAAAAGFGYLIWRTSTGFRLRMVGISTSAARYAGVDVGMAWILAMGLAGMLAGLGGAAYLLGQQKSVRGGFPGFGFDGIALALLGRTKPVGVVLAAFLFGALRAGSVGMQAKTSVPVDLIVVIQALIVVFVAAPALIRGIWRVRTPDTSGLEHVSTGWGK